MSALIATGAPEGARARAHQIRWLFNGAGVGALASDPASSALLAGAQPYVMRGPLVASVPAKWDAISFVSFARFEALREGLGNGKVGPEIRGIMYDYEKWRFTPQEEQANPAPYIKQAAELVHARGLLFMTAPALNLVSVMAPESAERKYETFLRLGLAADAARYADVFNIQAQGFERNPALYADFVRRAAAQARAANPKVEVLAGISTQPSGQDVSADDILNCIAATRDVVDGYWFNIPQPSEYCPNCREFRPDIAVDVLRRVSR
jgi:hypothetical protein